MARSVSDLLTPEEARAMPCPFFREVINFDNVVQYDQTPRYVHSICMAEDCIMWRRRDYDTRLGYCGVGGMPRV